MTTNSETSRSACIRLLTEHLGEAGLREFLRQRQPGMEDRYGCDLLQHHSDELLLRLKMIEHQTDENE